MTPHLDWFSAKIRTACLVEPSGANQYMDCVHVFHAKDWDSALQRAVAIGRSHEQVYRNQDGREVRWKLKEVLALNSLPGGILDGAEVHSEFVDLGPGEALPFNAVFHPERSQPAQTM